MNHLRKLLIGSIVVGMSLCAGLSAVPAQAATHVSFNKCAMSNSKVVKAWKRHGSSPGPVYAFRVHRDRNACEISATSGGTTITVNRRGKLISKARNEGARLGPEGLKRVERYSRYGKRTTGFKKIVTLRKDYLSPTKVTFHYVDGIKELWKGGVSERDGWPAAYNFTFTRKNAKGRTTYRLKTSTSATWKGKVGTYTGSATITAKKKTRTRSFSGQVRANGRIVKMVSGSKATLAAMLKTLYPRHLR